MDYFPHDTDAVNDEKIEALRFLYGNDGYAFYFILLERIYRTKHFELDVSDAETIQILCRKVCVNEEKFLQMLETALKRGCFDRQAYEERKVLTSEGVKKRSSVVEEKRVKMRDKYQKDKEVVEEVSDAETTPEIQSKTPQSKVKESKEKKSKELNKIKFADTVFLTQEEYDRLIGDFGKSVVDDYIERLDEWQSNNPKKQKRDHNKTLRVWMKDIKQKSKTKVASFNEYVEERKVVSSVNGSLF